MSKLKTGFARVDITPALGTTLAGYYEIRHMEGILDPIYATAVVFDDSEKRAVVISIDHLGINQMLSDELRLSIAEAIGTKPEGVFLACTHTHLGPCVTNAAEGEGDPVNHDYIEFLKKRLCDVATMAFSDIAETKMLYATANVDRVSFVRRFRMRDGTVQTNPGWQNPNIDYPLDVADETASLLILKRKDEEEIGIVNFQVHPDVIGGTYVSADYPKFVRDTYEKMIPNSRCMYINGAQGDTNHIDVSLGENECRHGYERSRYTGEKIALSVVANYPLAKELSDGKVSFGQKNVIVKYNKGADDELEDAIRVNRIYKETGSEEAALPQEDGMKRTELVARAVRIASLSELPDEKELHLTAISVGNVAFAGFPGEPFTEVGRIVKSSSSFVLAIPACCANGYEGYYPTAKAYDEGGYEVATARYAKGTAEILADESVKLLESIKQ